MVLPRLNEGLDAPGAQWWNDLFTQLRTVEQTLGTDPSNLGSAWSTFADVAAILKALMRIEVGEFELEYPEDSPTPIYFGSQNRWTDKSKIIVLVRFVGSGDGRWVPPDCNLDVDVFDPASDPGGNNMWGFNFVRYYMVNATKTEKFQYLAWEDTL